MLPESVKQLIREEQKRQGGAFVNTDLEAYIEKLDDRAELVVDLLEDRCRAFVAYYCNDLDTRVSFITLVLVNPEDRGLGLGEALTRFVLDTSLKRGFRACRLEVDTSNTGACRLYQKLGFVIIEERQDKFLMEASL